MLPDATTPGSPAWWLLRLGKRLEADQPRFDKLERYWRGDPPLPHGNRKMREAYRRLQRLARTNFGALIAEALLERLKVMGFRAGSDATDEADKTAWAWWQRNDLDADSGLVHRAAVVMGRSYVIVGPDPADDSQPLVTAEDPRQVIHESSPTNRRDVRAALKTWWDDVESAQLAVLYLPDTIHYYRTTAGTKRDSGNSPWAAETWEIDTTEEYPDGEAKNPLGEVPVTPFVNRPDMAGEGLGEFQDVVDILDRINTVILDRLVISAMQAYRQRYATGVDLTDEDGNPSADFDPGADLLWAVPDEKAKFGEFQPTDLTPIVKAVESDVQYLAAITRTPPHYLLAGIVNAPLALDTVVPVPGGRSTMGQLTVGDEVFDPDGQVQRVVGVSPVYHGRTCYRMTFSDGTTVVADEEHQWTTTHFSDPQRPYWRPVRGSSSDARRRGAFRETTTVTTREIAASLHTLMGTRNHHIDVAAAPDGPARDYSIDPYVLGVWLGDGDRVHGLITSHVADAEEMAGRLRECGEIVDVAPYSANDTEHRDCRFLKIRHDRGRCPFGHDRAQGSRLDQVHCKTCDRIRQLDKYHGRSSSLGERTNLSFVARLKTAGLWKNKHIPEEYFHGSSKQRLALLQGLMDTDGTVKRGQSGVELGFHDERLSVDALRLIQSLGHKVTLRAGRFTSKSKGISGDRWRLVWSARDPLFRLDRKAQLQNLVFEGDRQQKPFRRYIVACEPVESVPVRCITVTGSSHLFCITDAFIATHNSGDALAVAETGLASKAMERDTEYGNSWERVNRQTGKLQGREIGPDAEALWRDPQFHSLSQMAAANVQLMQAGVPWRTRMRLLDMSPAEIDRMEAERAHDAMLSSMLAPLPIDKGVPQNADAPQGQPPQPSKVPAAARGPRNGQVPAP